MPANGSRLLGMPNCAWLKATDCELKNKKKNQQTKQDKLKTKSDYKITLYTYNKVNPEADYFVAGPNMETGKAASAKTTIKMHNEFTNEFTDISCIKGTLSLKVKENA